MDLLRPRIVTARDLRHDRAWREALRDDPRLLFGAPSPSTTGPRDHFDPAYRLRVVRMVDHMVQSIPSRVVTMPAHAERWHVGRSHR